MRKVLLVVAGLLLAGGLMARPAEAGVNFSIGLGFPVFGPVYPYPAPVYVAPPPVYYAPPVYYGPPRYYPYGGYGGGYYRGGWGGRGYYRGGRGYYR